MHLGMTGDSRKEEDDDDDIDRPSYICTTHTRRCLCADRQNPPPTAPLSVCVHSEMASAHDDNNPAR